jgi:hypothetical protein
MDIDNILKWMDDDNDVLASIQATLTLILNLKQEKKCGGSTPGRREIQRNPIEGHNQLFKYYFDKDCMYPPEIFRCRFRMRRSLCLQIIGDFEKADQYFVQKRDAAGRLGFSTLQKATAAIRILAYGCSADSVDEYLRMSMS